MSVEAITWALRQPITHSSAKFVLVVLANCASAENAHAFPSVAYLSTATGQDRKTVTTNLQRLQEWGLIEDTGKRVGATKQVLVYRLICGPDLFQPGEEKRNSSENGTVPKTEAKTPVFPRKDPQKRDTEPSVNVSNRQREARAPRGTRLPPSWEPSAESQSFAKRERPDLDLTVELAKFRDHWLAEPDPRGIKADWDAAWRNWIRRADAARAGAVQSTAPSTQPAKQRDWREDPESKLENELRYIQQQFECGAFDDCEDPAAERDRLVAEAHRKHAPTAAAA